MNKGSLRQILATFCISLTPLVAGAVLGYTSPALPSLKNKEGFGLSQQELTLHQESWIGSLNALAAVLGSVIAAYFTDYFGRKRTLMFICLPGFLVSLVIIGCSVHITMMYIGRIIGGLMTGITYVGTSVYMVESTEPSVRGLTGSLPHVFTCLGVLLIYTVGLGANWQVIAFVFAGSTIPCIALMFLIPESPVWLMKNGRTEEAERALCWLRNTDPSSLKEEMEQISKKFEAEAQNTIKTKDFLKPSIFKPCLIAVALMFFKQTSGVNAVVYFNSQIFAASGSTLEPNICAVIFGAIQVVMTMLGCMLVDKAGRRPLQIFSSSVMVICLTCLGLFFFWKDHDHNTELVESTGWLPLACVLIFITGYSFGYGPLPNMVSSEIIPEEVRSVAVSITQATNWLIEFVVCELFLPMSDSAGTYSCFWMYASFCFLAVLFVLFIQPETKGKSLAEIRELFT